MFSPLLRYYLAALRPSPTFRSPVHGTFLSQEALQPYLHCHVLTPRNVLLRASLAPNVPERTRPSPVKSTLDSFSFFANLPRGVFGAPCCFFSGAILRNAPWGLCRASPPRGRPHALSGEHNDLRASSRRSAYLRVPCVTGTSLPGQPVR